MHIVFFNHFHNGDIHVSRGFVRKIIGKVRESDPTVTFSYAHKNDPSLLSDIDGLGFTTINGLVKNEHVGRHQVGTTIYVNTWYAQQNFRFMNSLGITFDCLYSIFDDHCRNLFNFSLQDISSNPADFFPYIDYAKFNLTRTAQWIASHPEKKVFVSNGSVLSGQADNFPMTPLIEKIALSYPDYTFILTNVENGHCRLPNVHYSSNIIGCGNRDLNENSFLSTHCDMIIGRASGTFTFAFVKENLFIRYPKFICFSNLDAPPNNKFWLSSLMKDKINYNAEIIVKNESNVSNVAQIIRSYL